jgi:DNA-binding transcriptional MerR regulator/methylmalonyl-CoA mutase cobalamin-binding subunit
VNNTTFKISSVERDTGLSKDVLRVWERRYGFPLPNRDSNGERCYSVDQVERLRLIKRHMDQGRRPGKLIGMPIDELKALAPRFAVPKIESAKPESQDINDLITLIKTHATTGYKQAMQQLLARHGLQRFVQDIVAPLTVRVGEVWEDGSLDVFEEHLFAEVTKRVMRLAIDALPGGDRWPRVLLTTVSDEQHSLGLLMAEAILALEGAECISYGIQLPLLEIGRAARVHDAHIVALSFSAAFQKRKIPGLLQELRLVLAPEVSLWAGGSGIAQLPKMNGIQLLPSLDDGLNALREWRNQHSDNDHREASTGSVEMPASAKDVS